MARDATARLYDVDEDSIVLDQKEGTVTFHAKKGKLVSLDKIHESVWATRLSGGTGMRLDWIEVTAAGEAVVAGKESLLKVTGSTEHFVLVDNPNIETKGGGKTPLDRLRGALDRGQKVVSVTGRVEGWSGHFPVFLRALPKKPRRIIVKDFQAAE